MSLCSICNSLQVDATTNESPDETNWPGPDRFKTFELYVPVQEWRESADGGCPTCRLVWEALLYFYGELVLELAGTTVDEDEPVNISLSGILGETLLLSLYPLPKETHFPGLEFFTYYNSQATSWPIIGPAGDIAPSLNLERCLELCKRWITACEQEHPQCQSDRVQPLPTRVLDLGQPGLPVNVRLYEPLPSSKACYIALSYCWGKVLNLTTTSSNLAQRKAGISWDGLSESFRHAILICRSLGVRYMWIDALCIIQDSPSDWEKEAARMADVYENAFLTIATDAARDPTWGILTPRHLEMISVQDAIAKPDKPRGKRNYDVLSVPIKDDTGAECIIQVREPLLHSDIVFPRTYHDVSYPLLTRAWTLQERLLARRTLHFTAFELIWECKQTLFCECDCIAREFHGLDGHNGPKVSYERAMIRQRQERDVMSRREDSDRDLGLANRPRMLETIKTWTLIIGGYTGRNLTFVTDKLPAIAGLARRYAAQVQGPSTPQPPATHQIYLAGLWLTDLPWLLCWRAFQRRFAQRPAEYCAPTWSWASLTTPVIWDYSLYDAAAQVEVLDATMIPQGLDGFGRVKGGSLTLTGYVKRATLDFDAGPNTVVGLNNENGDRIFFVPDQNPPDTNTGADGHDMSSDPVSKSAQRSVSSMSHGDAVACLWVLHNVATGAVYGLVLAVPGKTSIERSLRDHAASGAELAAFERIGLITSMSRKYQKDEISALSWFSGAEKQAVTIL
ncbi:hypothetical protein CGCSCA1_v013050 [Colletotrichum siamense]|nr:hypothetical protein CGCSCA1_v013050 [Colletotrichum siamense]